MAGKQSDPFERLSFTEIEIARAAEEYELARAIAIKASFADRAAAELVRNRTEERLCNALLRHGKGFNWNGWSYGVLRVQRAAELWRRRAPSTTRLFTAKKGKEAQDEKDYQDR